EALVRWNHPDHGLLGPQRFITLAERSGLMGRMTRAVMTLAFDQSARWKAAGLDVGVAVNVTPTSLGPDLPAQVAALAARHGVQPERVTLEITEQRLSGDPSATQAVLTRLRMQGFNLSLDDYGSEFSTAPRLRQLPFNEIKIDGEAIRRAVVDRNARSVLTTGLKIGRELQIPIVAEGVETRAEWDLIVDCCCQLAQGFYIARPLPADEVLAWTRARLARG
ncbi:MAG: EAL domain-containing protein, partial [Gammaproteobacteria bacterium]|nr:EAL domain-containing protein [Gammaproteobacteria bacterium]